MEEKLENFVPYPRSILYDLQEHRIDRNEYDLLIFLRHRADIYANVVVSLEGLTAEFKNRWQKNYVNQLMLSLKRKRYLYYADRAGRKGSFKVHFPDFKLPNGKISTVADSCSEEAAIHNAVSSKVSQRSEGSAQRSDDIKDRGQALVRKMSLSPDRGSYNDNETEKENKRVSFPLKEEKLVAEFVPSDHHEDECRKIALAIGEKDMRFLLGTLHKHGWLVIDQARREYQRADLSKVKNRAAYFNGIIKKIIANNSP